MKTAVKDIAVTMSLLTAVTTLAVAGMMAFLNHIVLPIAERSANGPWWKGF